MGVSFNISRQGKRYMHKQLDHDTGSLGSQTDDKQNENEIVMNEDSNSGFQNDDQQMENETGGNIVEVGDNVTNNSITLAKPKSGVRQLPEDLEVSFALNLFPDGFSVGKATELLSDVPKMLHPYDRASEELFSAIEYGYLPGDYFDDLPSKYVNGSLLCEVRDFRNCLAQMGDCTSHVKKSPIVHKALLKMSMENIIKDISSMSDGSWSYKDHLEVESRILKAMQPDLCLNPKPVHDIFSGELMTKKLNLGIPWSLKKRKLIDRLETVPVSGVGDIQNNESPPSLAFQEGGVPNFHKNIIPNSNPLLGEDNIVQDTVLPKEYVMNQPSSLREPGTLVLSEKGRCKKQTQGPIHKKPKAEPVEFSLQQLSGSQSKTILAPETRQMEKQLQQSRDSEKNLQRRVDGEKQSSPRVKDVQQVSLKGIPKLQSGVLSCPVKQESETSIISRSDSGHNYQKSQMHQSSSLSKTNVPANSIQLNDMSKPVEQYLSKAVTHERIPLKKPAVSTALGSASVNVNFNHRDPLLRESSVLGKRKLNSHPQGLNMNIVESLPSTRNMNAIETSSYAAGSSFSASPFGAKDDSILKRFSKIKMVAHRYGLHNRKQKVDKFLDKKPIFNSSLVAYHLNSKDNNLKAGNADDAFQTRTLDFVRPSHIYKGKEASIHLSETQTKLVLSNKPNERMVEGRLIHGQGKEIDADESPLESTFISTHEMDKFAAQFVSQMAREGFFLSGDKGSYPGPTEQGSSNQLPSASICATPTVITVMPPSPTPIPGQTPYIFSSLTRNMPTANPRQVPSQDFLTSGLLRQQSVDIDSATTETGTVQSPSPPLIPGQSPYMFSSITSNMPPLYPGQAPSHNFLSGASLLPFGNIWSARQFSANYSSNALLKNEAQISSLQLNWQQIIMDRVHLQYRMQQREHQQQQLMQRNMMMRGLPAASGNTGMMHLGVGSQGSANSDLGFLANFMDIGGSSSVSTGAHVPSLGYLDQVNYLGNTIWGFNGSDHFHGGISDSSDAALARMMLAQSQQRSLLRRVPVQRNDLAMIERSMHGMGRQPRIMDTNSSRVAMHPWILPHHAAYSMLNQQLLNIHTNTGMLPMMHQPTVPGMVCNFPGQQPPSMQIHEEIYITQLQLQYQRMIPPFQDLQMNQQLQVYGANQSVAPEIVGLSFPNVGSGVGSNENSTMAASDESDDISCTVNTGRIWD